LNAFRLLIITSSTNIYPGYCWQISGNDFAGLKHLTLPMQRPRANITDGMKGFDKLDIDSKSIFLQYNGRKIASIKYYNYRTTLYMVDHDLVEEYYDTETKEISRICAANNNDLKKYLEKIDISDIVK
jgi:hypothetical protein